MKSLAFLALSTIGISACQKEQTLPARNSIAGTYEVTRLAQYQNGQKTFDGYLPYLISDSTTINHKLGISLGNGTTDGTDAYIIQELIQSKGQHTRIIGRNIGGLKIKIEDTPSPIIFNLYRDGTTQIGKYEKGLLTFDLIEKDTLNQDVRYVFQAKKVSDIPNRF